MTERWQRDLRELEEIEPSEEFWSKVDAPHRRRRSVEPRSRRTGRVVSAVVVGAIVAAGIIVPLKLLAPLADRDKGAGPAGETSPTPPPDASSIPDVARILCRSGQAEVQTPQVQVQPDGFRLIAHSNDPGDQILLVETGSDLNSYGFDVAQGEDVKPSLLISPGEYHVVCINRAVMDPDVSILSAIKAALPTAPLISVVDPHGFYVPTTPGCPDGRTNGRLAADATENPDGAELVRRSVEGALPTDTVERSDYPDQGDRATRWRVVRDGRIIADVLIFSTDPQQLLISVSQCRIPGAANLNYVRAWSIRDAELLAGNSLMPLATAYTVPSYDHCNPYGDTSCLPVWLSALVYATYNNQDPYAEIGVGADPSRITWCKPGQSGESESCLAKPEDVPRVVFMPQTDAQRWFAQHDCGQAVEEICHKVTGTD
jgi:hypothetical protein